MAWSPEIKRLVTEAETDGRSALIPHAIFFEGNDDEGSIGCNLEPHPGIAVFRRVLDRIAQRPDVSGIWFEITDSDQELDWPFTDTAWIATSASEDELEAWRSELDADEVTTPGPRSAGSRLEPPAGQAVVGLWWD